MLKFGLMIHGLCCLINYSKILSWPERCSPTQKISLHPLPEFPALNRSTKSPFQHAPISTNSCRSLRITLHTPNTTPQPRLHIQHKARIPRQNITPPLPSPSGWQSPLHNFAPTASSLLTYHPLVPSSNLGHRGCRRESKPLDYRGR
jgi:hypothetical protein